MEEHEKPNTGKVVYPEIEGDPGNGYWYVCSECHFYIRWKYDWICPCCGGSVDWNA